MTPSRIPPSACDPRRPVCEGSDPPITIMTDDHIEAVRCAWTELTHDGAESFEEVCCHILWRKSLAREGIYAFVPSAVAQPAP